MTQTTTSTSVVASSRSSPAIRQNRTTGSLVGDVAGSLRQFEFWALASWLDIVVRYRQSRLGIFWLLLPALLYIFGMGYFFSSMMGRPLAEYAPHIALGWVVFRLVITCLSESAAVMSSSAAFIYDGHTRLSDFVFRTIAKAGFFVLVALPVVIVALMMHPSVSAQGLAAALFTLPLVLWNVLWLSIVFALAGARFPDISQLLSNVFIFAFFFTPIIWFPAMVRPGSIRAGLMYANPFFHLVEIVRAPILGEPLYPISLIYLAVMSIVGGVVAALVYRRYVRYVPLWV